MRPGVAICLQGEGCLFSVRFSPVLFRRVSRCLALYERQRVHANRYQVDASQLGQINRQLGVLLGDPNELFSAFLL